MNSTYFKIVEDPRKVLMISILIKIAIKVLVVLSRENDPGEARNP